MLAAARHGTAAADPHQPGGAHYREAISLLEAGDVLDLDSGAVGRFAARGDRGGEVVVLPAELRFEQPYRVTTTFAAMVAAVSKAPWRELTTSDGRLAAVQVLHGAAPIAVRFVVAPPGVTAWRRAPADPHCLGEVGRIDVWFDEDPSYLHYRIERRVGPTGAFAAAGTVDRPPFTDHDVERGVRYGYRIVGLNGANEESIPAEVQGTTASRGVVCGSVVYRFCDAAAGRSWDLLTGEASADAFDLRFLGTIAAGSRARFMDAAGREPPSYGVPDEDRTSPWDVPFAGAGRAEIDAGEPFFVALAGGGVARCAFRHDPATPKGRPFPDVRVDFVANPDGPTLGPATGLAVTRQPDAGVRIEVRGPADFAVETIEVRGPDGALLRRLRSTGRSATDVPPEGEDYRVYHATARDARGRAAAPGRVTLDERPPVPRSGEIELSRGTGFSFGTGAVARAEEADIAFAGSAGSADAVDLVGAAGIASVRTLTGWGGTGVATCELFGALVSFDPARVALRRADSADGRDPESGVFVLRCRSGGWAKIAVAATRRGERGDASAVTLAYVFHPRDPVFDPARCVVQVAGGLRLAKAIGADPVGGAR